MDYEFHIYFPRTNVHALKKMWGRNRQAAYQALLARQAEHAGGNSEFEIVQDESLQPSQESAGARHAD